VVLCGGRQMAPCPPPLHTACTRVPPHRHPTPLPQHTHTHTHTYTHTQTRKHTRAAPPHLVRGGDVVQPVRLLLLLGHLAVHLLVRGSSGERRVARQWRAALDSQRAALAHQPQVAHQRHLRAWRRSRAALTGGRQTASVCLMCARSSAQPHTGTPFPLRPQGHRTTTAQPRCCAPLSCSASGTCRGPPSSAPGPRASAGCRHHAPAPRRWAGACARRGMAGRHAGTHTEHGAVCAST
jgi:hypothetical protein